MYEEDRPTTVTVVFEVQNVGYRPTSLNEVRARVLDGSKELHGELYALRNTGEMAKLSRPYRPEEPPQEFVDLPMVIEAGITERLTASFRLDGKITQKEAKCILTVRYTGGEKTSERYLR